MCFVERYVNNVKKYELFDKKIKDRCVFMGGKVCWIAYILKNV